LGVAHGGDEILEARDASVWVLTSVMGSVWDVSCCFFKHFNQLKLRFFLVFSQILGKWFKKQLWLLCHSFPTRRSNWLKGCGYKLMVSEKKMLVLAYKIVKVAIKADRNSRCFEQK
jgi:hypothetical protein